MKKINLRKAKERAWKAFSLWVRLSATDEYGMLRCITCLNRKPYKEMQAGHFISGRRNAVLFSVEGVHPQCYGCNVMMHGNWIAYYEYMQKMYGQEMIEELIRESKRVVKYTVDDLLAIEAKYKRLVEDINKYL